MTGLKATQLMASEGRRSVVACARECPARSVARGAVALPGPRKGWVGWGAARVVFGRWAVGGRRRAIVASGAPACTAMLVAGGGMVGAGPPLLARGGRPAL